jgi:pyrroloquinoline quinone biosynthesis protein B
LKAGVEAIVLGVAQDAGVPQAGCDCPRCRAAGADPARRILPAALGLVDHAAGEHWLVDATPALPEQWARLRRAAPGSRLSGVFVTHAHMGHYVGLAQLGPEAAAVRAVDLFATERMHQFLARNRPWSGLMGAHLVPRALEPGAQVALSDRLRVRALLVPHRGEDSDTVALVVSGPSRRILYCPDTDGWDEWDVDIGSFLVEARIDIALLDGTFCRSDELPGRDMASVRHPLATDTAARLAGVGCEVRLIHLNHTNDLLDDPGERARVGLPIATTGDRWRLDA